MATVPSQRTWLSGEVVMATMLNSNVRDAVTFSITSRPHAVLRRATTQSIPNANNSFDAIQFDTEDRDNDSAHSTVTNTSRFTAVTAGWYMVTGSVSWVGSSGGRRGSRWAINGTPVPGTEIMTPPAGNTSMGTPAVSTDVFLNVGDFLELFVFQDSGAALNVSNARMTVRWISTA